LSSDPKADHDKVNNAQTPGADLTPEFHFVGCDHPILHFHLISTECREILQSAGKELPLLITVGTVVKAALQGHHRWHGVIVAQI
jgi:hypothetical protein